MTPGELQRHCLAKPGAWPDNPWDHEHPVIKVGEAPAAGKIFAFLGDGSVGVKAGTDREQADEWLARYPDDAAVMAYIGRSGWNTLRGRRDPRRRDPRPPSTTPTPLVVVQAGPQAPARRAGRTRELQPPSVAFASAPSALRSSRRRSSSTISSLLGQHLGPGAARSHSVANDRPREARLEARALAPAVGQPDRASRPATARASRSGRAAVRLPALHGRACRSSWGGRHRQRHEVEDQRGSSPSVLAAEAAPAARRTPAG